MDKTAESFPRNKALEVEAEMNSGKVPEEIDSKHRQMAIDLDYQDDAKSIGGKELSISNKSLFGKSWAEVQMP